MRGRRLRVLLRGLVFVVAGLLIVFEVQFTAGIVVLVVAVAYVARGLLTAASGEDHRT